MPLLASCVDKATLRTEMRQRIAAIPPLARSLQEELVNAAIMGTPNWQRAGTVLVYKHKGAEFSVNSLANQAFRTGKRVLFPRVDGDRLVLHHVLSWDGLEPGSFGIHEPSPRAPEVDASDVDVVIVPGLAWAVDGKRLGQGGGFFDRLLPGIGGVSFGVGFDEQLLDELPVEDHDQEVEKVWTADGVTQQ